MRMAAPRATSASRPDCELTCPDQNDLDDLRRAGVDVLALIKPVPVMTAAGYVAHDNRFEPNRDSEVWFVFDEPSVPDLIFWHRKTGRLATHDGRAFALGESIIGNPGTYAFGHGLNIFADPVEWLRARRDGIVIIPDKWPLLFDRVRDLPRVVLSPGVVSLYHRHIRPPRMPKVFVAAPMTRTTR
jgi:hypothetical protein